MRIPYQRQHWKKTSTEGNEGNEGGFVLRFLRFLLFQDIREIRGKSLRENGRFRRTAAHGTNGVSGVLQ
jgi:hypothetical protein